MAKFHHLGFLLILTLASTKAESQHIKLPDDLLMGTATSSYQVEGAWNEDGKAENIWDHFTHTKPEAIDDKSNGDIACDSYHKLKEDIALLKEIGAQFYRFSLSWARILPSGFPNQINEFGVKYYNNLIDSLLAQNITPMATIYHWDFPQSLQNLGGFVNPESVQWFEDYSRVVFDKFGDRVKLWITINEPKQICDFGYEQGVFAPGLKSSGIGNYICAHNVVKAHARAYHLYDKEFRPKQKGQVGYTVEASWSEPASEKQEDIDAAERRRQFDFGRFISPIYHRDGDYPKVVKEFVAKRSRQEGFLRSRLPEFTPEEVKYIQGTADFFGLNHYTTLYVKDIPDEPIGEPAQAKDVRVDTYQDPNWITGAFDYFRLVPWGFKKTLKYIKENYGNPDVYITENGFPTLGELNDTFRIKYHQGNLKALVESVQQDKVKVKAYAAWSLMDNFEWASGYTIRFGMYYVDFNDPQRPRKPKSSAKFYKDLLSTRKLIVDKDDSS